MNDANGNVPLLLIHGAWLSARRWENYHRTYFSERGYAVSAPEWPRKHGDVEEMRETAEESAGLGIQEIVHHYEGLIKDLDQPPVLPRALVRRAHRRATGRPGPWAGPPSQ